MGVDLELGIIPLHPRICGFVCVWTGLHFLFAFSKLILYSVAGLSSAP
jgi:hypothetical protein